MNIACSSSVGVMVGQPNTRSRNRGTSVGRVFRGEKDVGRVEGLARLLAVLLHFRGVLVDQRRLFALGNALAVKILVAVFL
jgi:hypothetical protein